MSNLLLILSGELHNIRCYHFHVYSLTLAICICSTFLLNSWDICDTVIITVLKNVLSANFSIMSVVAQFWLISLLLTPHVFLPLCMPGVLWLDARHCQFPFLGTGCYGIPLNLLEFCSGVQLSDLLTVGSLWILLSWFLGSVILGLIISTTETRISWMSFPMTPELWVVQVQSGWGKRVQLPVLCEHQALFHDLFNSFFPWPQAVSSEAYPNHYSAECSRETRS